jgi:peptide/nickel transport system permease protein
MSNSRRFFKRLLTNPFSILGLVLVCAVMVCAVLAPVLTALKPSEINYDIFLLPPGAEHLMGGDDLGRDVFSRVLYGARLSLTVGLLSQAIALVLGLVVGLLAGYVGGIVDTLLMRFVDLVLAFPFVILAIALVVALGPNLINSYIALGLAGWPYLARVVRAQVLISKETDFVQAAISLGASPLRIVMRHIFPAVIAPLIVLSTSGIAAAILAEAGLSFLGLGVQPPEPSWGSMLFAGRGYLREAPWISGFPGLAIFMTVLGFNLLGDGLRDALDVKV